MNIWFLRVIIITSFCILLFGTFAKIMHFPLANDILIANLVFQILSMVSILIDMYRNKIFYNNPLWIGFIIALGSIASIVYLIRRNELLMRRSSP